MKTLILFIVLAVCSSIAAYAQSSSTHEALPNAIPPSPTAASLGKYGEIPVGLYTGVPDISIPIWEVRDGELSVPLSLSYHASGIRVEETASWVGLGWSLNAGGAITRTVRGQPDEVGYLNPSLPKIPVVLLDPNAQPQTPCDREAAAQYCHYVAEGSNNFDSEPDLYYFNFNGIQGKFVFDQDGGIHTVPFQKIRIEHNKKIGNKQYAWVVTTVDGTKYKFSDAETTVPFSAKYYYDNTLHFLERDEFRKQVNNGYESTWYLNEIESPAGRKITFTYTDENLENRGGVSERKVYEVTSGTEFAELRTMSGLLTRVYGKRLQTINFSTGSISFATADRSDVGALQGDNPQALSKIVIKNSAGVSVKNFVLGTSYFLNNGSNIPYFNKRLKLTSLTEYSGDMAQHLPPHQFFYDERHPLPIRESTSQDHWGYYNGKNNVDAYGIPTLIPSIKKMGDNLINLNCSSGSSTVCLQQTATTTFNGQGVSFSYKAADRSQDTTYSKVGILERIVYPTGGYTTFDYEAHDYALAPGEQEHEVVASDTWMVGSNRDVNYYNNAPILTGYNGGDNYYQIMRFTPGNSIPADFKSLNPRAMVDLSFIAEVNGLNYRCCETCSPPEGYLKDVTTNTIIVSYTGLTGIQANGVSGLTPDNYYTNVTGNSSSWPAVPTWLMQKVELDPTHTYEILAVTQNCQSCHASPDCTMDVPRLGSYILVRGYYKTDRVLNYNGYVGGLRIKQINSYSAVSKSLPVTKRYLYRLSDKNPNNAISSGEVLDWPIYSEDVQHGIVTGALGVITANYLLACLTSGSKFELGQTNGSHIGYSEVQEVRCLDLSCTGSPNGKTVSKYTSPSDYPDVNTSVQGFTKYAGVTSNPPCQLSYLEKYTTSALGNFFPYAPKVSFDWKRGLLKSQAVYDSQNRLRHLLEKTYNSSGDTVNQKIIYGLRIAHGPLWELIPPQGSGVVPPNTHNLGLPSVVETFYSRYDLISAWNYTTQEKVTEYDENGNAVVNVSDYFYDNPRHAQLTRVTKSTSEPGKTITQKITYPGDYQTSEADATTSLMKSKRFMHSLPIEKSTWQQTATAKTVLSSQVMRYRTSSGPNGDTLIVKAELAELESARPLAYNPGNPANEFPTYLPVDGYQASYWQNKFKRRVTYAYDAYGNVTQAQPEHSTPVCYLWGYKGTRLVAEIKNVTYAQVKAVLGLTTTGPIDLGSSGLTTAQEAALRTQLPGTLLTTYKYEPLVGMTSQTGPDSRTTFYEYDSLGRLVRTRDEQGRILGQQQYHYAGQP